VTSRELPTWEALADLAMKAGERQDFAQALVLLDQIALHYPKRVSSALLRFVDRALAAIDHPMGEGLRVEGITVVSKCDDPAHQHEPPRSVRRGAIPDVMDKALAFVEARAALDVGDAVMILASLSTNEEVRGFALNLLNLTSCVARFGAIPAEQGEKYPCGTPGCPVPTGKGKRLCVPCAASLSTTDVSLRNARPAAGPSSRS